MRRLDRIRIERIESEAEDLDLTDGHHAVHYAANGRCAPYVVTLVDDQDARLVIDVDAFSTPTIETYE